MSAARNVGLTTVQLREIARRSYSTDKKGFDGNEDCGQMSAWYILSALVFYPFNGKRLAEPQLRQRDIVAGGTLEFVMGAEPNAEAFSKGRIRN